MFTFCMIVSIRVYSGALNFGPAVGVERVNNLFNVDLGAIKGLYRFDNGVTIGGVAMFGDISFQDNIKMIADKNRVFFIFLY